MSVSARIGACAHAYNSDVTVRPVCQCCVRVRSSSVGWWAVPPRVRHVRLLLDGRYHHAACPLQPRPRLRRLHSEGEGPGGSMSNYTHKVRALAATRQTTRIRRGPWRKHVKLHAEGENPGDNTSNYTQKVRALAAACQTTRIMWGPWRQHVKLHAEGEGPGGNTSNYTQKVRTLAETRQTTRRRWEPWRQHVKLHSQWERPGGSLSIYTRCAVAVLDPIVYRPISPVIYYWFSCYYTVALAIISIYAIFFGRNYCSIFVSWLLLYNYSNLWYYVLVYYITYCDCIRSI